MLRTALLMMSGDPRVRRLVSTAPLTRGVVERFVAGEDVTAAVRVAGGLRDAGLRVSLDLLGEDVTDHRLAEESAAAYGGLLRALADAGLTPAAEVSVKLSALGARVDAALARDLAFRVCQAARDAGTCVTVDMEDHTTTDATLAVVADLRREFDETGAVVQAYLRRTEADCRDLAAAGGRVRLCKGAYAEPASAAYVRRAEVNASYARCLAILMAGQGYPMVATHDPVLIELAAGLAGELAAGRLPASAPTVGDRPAERVPTTPQAEAPRAAVPWDAASRGAASRGAASRGAARRPFEYQMLYGVRPGEQRRLAEAGEMVRVYVPCGREWYGYLMRRLAERPANLLFFARALRSTA
ncbi:MULTISPECIES: proline dehydrogenase family protein [unclassified Frankia]|uniref:proline dehydrogenase family protein n=1 Tax=unclassified Frankia TaxID=2632575 RepID=UPI00404472FA